MYDVIREWPRYLKVPFPIAKVKTVEVDDDMQRCIYISPLYSFFYCYFHAKNIHNYLSICWCICCYLLLPSPPLIA